MKQQQRLISLKHCGGFRFWPHLLLAYLNLRGNKVWVAPKTLCSLQWHVVLPNFKQCCIVILYFFKPSFTLTYTYWISQLLFYSVHQKHGQASVMKAFAKIVKDCQPLAVRCLAGFLIHICVGVFYTIYIENRNRKQKYS